MNEFAAELEGALAQVERATESELVEATLAEMEEDNNLFPVDEGLVEKYTKLMDQYVNRKSQRLLLEKLAAAAEGDASVLEVPDSNDPGVVEERNQRRERRQQVLDKLMATFEELQSRSELVKIQQAALQAEKQDLMDRVDEFRTAQEDRRAAELFGGSSSLSQGSGVEDLDDDDDADVEELNREGERLMAIQRRSAELQAQIERYKRKNLKLTRALQAKSENLPPEVRDCLADDGPVTESTMSAITTLLHELKDQNAQMEAQIELHTEMAEFYTGMRECLEELRGVRVLSVKDSSSLPSARVARRPALQCAFLLLDKYELDVELQSRGSTRGGATSGGDGPSQQLVPVHAAFKDLDVSLDDLVVSDKPSLADRHLYPNGADRLRRLVVEALARIHLKQQRALHLDQLRAMSGIQAVVAGRNLGNSEEGQQENAGEARADSQWLVQIFPTAKTSDASAAAATSHPAVARWVAVLSLSPDCPIIPGSVRLTQLVGLDDEGVEVKDDSLMDTVHRINETSFASPVELVKQLSKALRG